MHQHEMDIYRNRFESFGFAVFKVDGHNILELIEIFEKVPLIKLNFESVGILKEDHRLL